MLCYKGREALFGGAAGGGKSACLMMQALQYADVAGYGALLMRRTYPQLSKSGGLIELSREWLSPTDAEWNEAKKRWRFPSGAIIQFGQMEHESDKYNYQGDEYQFVGLDESTQFSSSQIEYITTRIRRRANVNVPLRLRMASNPGNESHEWHKARFITNANDDHIFIPSLLDDNPFVDAQSYKAQLMALSDEVLMRQLLEGNWDIMATGEVLRGDWFEVVDVVPKPTMQVRAWDVAGTVRRKDGRESDETVGTLGHRDAKTGIFYITDQVAFRKMPGDVEDMILATMEADEAECRTLTVEEKPPGEAGVAREQQRLKRFAGHWYQCLGSNVSKKDRVTGVCRDPEERALSLASLAQRGFVKLKRAPWNDGFKAQCNIFGQANVHDDRVDSASLLISSLARQSNAGAVRSGIVTTRNLNDLRAQTMRLLGRS